MMAIQGIHSRKQYNIFCQEKKIVLYLTIIYFVCVTHFTGIEFLIFDVQVTMLTFPINQGILVYT